MSTPLRELLAVFGIDVDPEHNLEKGDKKVEEFAEKLKKITKTIAEAFGAEKLFEFVKSQVEVNEHLQNLSNRLDVSASDIRSFGLVAVGAGVDLDSAAHALGFFERQLGKAGGTANKHAASMAKLGIATKETTGETRPLTDLLGDVADKLSQVTDHNKAAAMAADLFGRSVGTQLLPMLSRGREAFEEEMRAAAALGDGLGDEFYANVTKAAEGFEKFDHVLQSLKNRALDAILPAVKLLGIVLLDAGEWLLDLDKHTHVLQAGFVVLAGVIGVGLVLAIEAATAALWALVGPFVIAFGPAIAAAFALVWVIQDLWNLMTGGPSIIGNIIEKLDGLGGRKRAVGQLHEAFNALVDAIAGATYAVFFFIGASAGLAKITAGNHAVLDFFLTLGKFVASAMRLLGGFFGMFGHGIAGIAKALVGASMGDYGAGNDEFAKAGKSADSAGNAVFGKNGILGEAGFGQHSTDVRNYGVDPDMVGRHAKSFERGNGPDVSGANEASREPTAPHVGGRLPGPTVFRAPHVGGSTTPVALTVHNSFTVHTKSDKPKEIGDETGSAVASHSAKAMRNALASRVKP